MRHRLISNSEAEAEGITTYHIIEQILQDVPVTTEAVGI
jgi:MoxR-like ATPase